MYNYGLIVLLRICAVYMMMMMMVVMTFIMMMICINVQFVLNKLTLPQWPAEPTSQHSFQICMLHYHWRKSSLKHFHCISPTSMYDNNNKKWSVFDGPVAQYRNITWKILTRQDRLWMTKNWTMKTKLKQNVGGDFLPADYPAGNVAVFVFARKASCDTVALTNLN